LIAKHEWLSTRLLIIGLHNTANDPPQSHLQILPGHFGTAFKFPHRMPFINHQHPVQATIHAVYKHFGRALCGKYQQILYAFSGLAEA
jgi:hypothetical protein